MSTQSAGKYTVVAFQGTFSSGPGDSGAAVSSLHPDPSGVIDAVVAGVCLVGSDELGGGGGSGESGGNCESDGIGEGSESGKSAWDGW